MVNLKGAVIPVDELKRKAAQIKLMLTDNDGVMTDTGVYYSDRGEELKRYSVRDGMGVERLKKVLNINTGIITGENSPSLIKRCEKLGIESLYLGTKDKLEVFHTILKEKKLQPENIAYIGDDYNDIEIINAAGLTACPADAMPHITTLVDYICGAPGGRGAFRDFAELLIMFNQ